MSDLWRLEYLFSQTSETSEEGSSTTTLESTTKYSDVEIPTSEHSEDVISEEEAEDTSK